MRNGLRLGAIQAHQGGFMPPPDGLFYTGSSSDAGSVASGSSGDKDPVTGEYLTGHEIALRDEQAALDMEVSQLRQEIYEKLRDEYGGDISRFQEGEMQKFIDSKRDLNADNYYSRYYRQHSANNMFYTNRSAAKAYRKNYDEHAAKVRGYGALGQIVTMGNQPLQYKDGHVVVLTKDANSNQYKYYSIDGQTTFDYDEDEQLPYVTQQDYMNLMERSATKGKDGLFIAPRYMDAYDAKQNYFQKALDRIAERAAGIMNSSEGNKFTLMDGYASEQELMALSGKGKLSEGEKQRMQELSYMVVANTKVKGASNQQALDIARKNVLNSMSDIEQRDMLEEYWKAKQSGYVYTNEDGEEESGNKLTLGTFLNKRIAGTFDPLYRQETSMLTSYEDTGDYNKSINEQRKMTPLAYATNVAAIQNAATHRPAIFSYPMDVNGKFVKADADYYTAPMWNEAQKNDHLRQFLGNGTSFNERYITPASALGKSVMLANGQWINTDKLGEGRIGDMDLNAHVFPQFEMNPDGTYSQRPMVTMDSKGTQEIQKQGYLSYYIYIPDAKQEAKSVRKSLDLIRGDDSKSKEMKVDDRTYVTQIERELGGKYIKDPITKNNILVIPVYVPGSTATALDGASSTTASTHNYRIANNQINESIRVNENRNKLKQISQPK